MITLESLSHLMGAQLHLGHEHHSIQIKSVAPLESAAKGDLSFFSDLKYKEALISSKASAVVLTEKIEGVSFAQLIHPNPRLALAKVTQKLFPKKHSFQGQSALAYVHKEALVHKTVTLYPHVTIDKGAQVAEECTLYPGVYVGPNCIVGKGSTLYPNCVLMEGCVLGEGVVIHGGSVLGGDGFGFVPTKEENVKVPQLGNVVIEDDVEIGALCTIDRGTYDKTIIRKGTKLDSQVHVGHNVDIGEKSLVAAQVAFGGCAKVGERFVAAGQSGVGAAAEVSAGVTLGPKTGIMQDVKESGVYMGHPVGKLSDWKRQRVSLMKLPSMRYEFEILKKKVKELEKRLEN